MKQGTSVGRNAVPATHGNSSVISVDAKELQQRIEKNYNRLCEPYYQIQEVFSDTSYDWQGDKEGRALLAFVSHYKISKRKIPCMEQLIAALPQKANRYFYFGKEPEKFIDEQQLSGHNWYLRGLLEYYEQFGDEKVLSYARSTVENLYLPLSGKFCSYPIERKKKTDGGDVSGSESEILNSWKLSTDVGCAFMCIDGLSHYYALQKDARVKKLIDEMQIVFDKIDKCSLKAQTHCCLTAARGFLRMYKASGEEKYLRSAENITSLYIASGMTYTYQNYNWWNRGNTWTEPCAVIDSLMVMAEMYKITKREGYRITAARIWHNGFAVLQVGNGGAETSTTVNRTEPILRTLMYEAFFCCTMRLAEGLCYVYENADILWACDGKIKKDEKGRYMAGDILYAEVDCPPEFERYICRKKEIWCDGINLQPLVKYYNLPREVTDALRQKIVFTD